MDKKFKVLLILIAIAGVAIMYLSSRDSKTIVNSPVASLFTPDWRDLGEIRVYGDGLPGYDVNRNGRPDYVESGFFPYVELNKTGGFDYSGGKIHIKETGANITLPAMQFAVSHLTESRVGSIIIFNGENDNIKASVIVKTLGRSVTTYILAIESPMYTYRLADILDERGSGTFEKGEIEGSGIIRL